MGEEADDEDCDSGPDCEEADGWFDRINDDSDRRLGIIDIIESLWPGMSTPSEEEVMLVSSLHEIHG